MVMFVLEDLIQMSWLYLDLNVTIKGKNSWVN
jgi:hypothetical protein